MAISDVVASCKKLCTDPEQGPEKQFYALVLTNPHQHTFDIAVTDGTDAWSGTGLTVTKPPGFTEEEAWRRARELLTDEVSSAKPAALTANTELASGELQFTWRWERDVGAGRHIMKLPAAAAAHTTLTAAGTSSTQQSGVLVKQQPPAATIKHILDTLVTSYSKMQSSLRVCGSSQSSLSSSLDVLRAQLDSQAATHKERERELYLKFTMLLNQKTRQLQKEHQLVQQLSAEVERLKGEADHDTDDEAREAAYAADEAAAAGDAGADTDTDPDPDDHNHNAVLGYNKNTPAPAVTGKQRLPASAAGGGAAVIPDSEGVEGTAAGLALPAASGVAAGASALAARAANTAMDIDLAATQLLPESELEDFLALRVRQQQQ